MKWSNALRFLAAAIVFVAHDAARSQETKPPKVTASVADLIRYEPTGLSLLQPYEKGRIPVLFVHGLWVNPSSWHVMVEALGATPGVRDRFQFWTYGYSTGDPIPYTATLLRRDLDEVRLKVDPDRSDPAIDRMVVVGHSMGGLLVKFLAVNPSDRLWRVMSKRPAAELKGEKADVEMFRNAMFFEPRSEIRRVVFIATPHLGSRIDRGSIQKLGSRLIRTPDPLRAAHDRLVAGNVPEFFQEHFRKGLPTSIDELEWGSPLLAGLSDLAINPAVKTHSIVAVRPGSKPNHRTDGLVTFESAHLEGVTSEKVVDAPHLCQDNPDVIAEVRRILMEHAGS